MSDDDKPRTSSSLRTAAISKAALAMIPKFADQFRRHLDSHQIALDPQRIQDLARYAAAIANDALVEERRAIDANRCPQCGAPKAPLPIDPRREPED